MKNRLLSNAAQVLTLVLIAAISATGIAVFRSGNTESASNATMPRALAAPAQAGAAAIAGLYNGPVALKFTLGGVYSDTLATPAPPSAGTPAPADVGEIDLSLFLIQSGTTISGYVSLDKTLVFSVEHTILATPEGITPVPGQSPPAAVLPIGPRVQGSFDGTTLNLESERVTVVVAGRTVQRQFRIIGTLKPGEANTLIGEYRETLWGYAPQPLTVLGTVTLSRPLTQPFVPNANNATPTVTATASPSVMPSSTATAVPVVTSTPGPAPSVTPVDPLSPGPGSSSTPVATPHTGSNNAIYLPMVRR